MKAQAYKLEGNKVVDVIIVDTDSDFDYEKLGYVLDSASKVKVGHVKSDNGKIEAPLEVKPTISVEGRANFAIGLIRGAASDKATADSLRNAFFYAQLGMLDEVSAELKTLKLNSLVQQIKDFQK